MPAEEWAIGSRLAMQHQFRGDVFQSGFGALSSSTNQPSATVPGWTFNECRHSSKPCSLYAMQRRQS